MLSAFQKKLDAFNEKTGSILSVTPLLLVILQFIIIVMISLFQVGSIQLQESLQYINALMFLGGAGYTLKHNEHVRVDLFYSKLSQRHKDIIDLFGTIVLLLPFIGLIWVAGLPFVLDSWSEMEGSVEASGLPFVYILKTTILLFALSLSLQVVSNLISLSQRLKENSYD